MFGPKRRTQAKVVRNSLYWILPQNIQHKLGQSPTTYRDTAHLMTPELLLAVRFNVLTVRQRKHRDNIGRETLMTTRGSWADEQDAKWHQLSTCSLQHRPTNTTTGETNTQVRAR